MLNSILTRPLTLPALLACFAAAALLGVVTALVFTFGERHSAGFALTLALMPLAVATIILLVNGSIGTGVAVAGAFALVRFRSAPGTAREIAAIISEMALGLALGMGYVGLAAIFGAIVCLLTLALTALRFGAPSPREKQLRMTVSEDLDYESAFDDVFAQHGVRARLERVRTTHMGTLFELTYALRLPDGGIPKGLIDDLRVRNGNLSILIGAAPERESL